MGTFAQSESDNDDNDENEEGGEPFASSEADIIAETFALQVKAMQDEGFPRVAIACGISQVASEMIWEIYEETR